MLDDNELRNRFTYHPPTLGTLERYEESRNLGAGFASWINSNVPDSREKSIALTKIDEVVMWANAGIARHTKEN